MDYCSLPTKAATKGLGLEEQEEQGVRSCIVHEGLAFSFGHTLLN